MGGEQEGEMVKECLMAEKTDRNVMSGDEIPMVEMQAKMKKK